MGFKTDIEIAQETEMLPITEIAKKAGIEPKYLEQYGNYKAKIDYNLLNESDKPNGKLVLVTAINPTPAGEGKTTTTDFSSCLFYLFTKSFQSLSSRQCLLISGQHSDRFSCSFLLIQDHLGDGFSDRPGIRLHERVSPLQIQIGINEYDTVLRHEF